jgi:LysR family hydrogen peroxide-inducible transcriptional activator
LIPGLAVKTEATRARLHVRPFQARSAHRTIAVIWRKGTAAEPALRAIATVLRQGYPKG